MKKIILLFTITFLISESIISQNQLDSIRTCIQYFNSDIIDIETDSGIAIFQYNSKYLSRKLYQYSFSKDSTILNAFKNLDSINLILPDSLQNGRIESATCELQGAIKIFILSKQYSYLNIEHLIDSFAFLNDGRFYIKNFLDTLPLSKLLHFMNKYQDCDVKFTFYSNAAVHRQDFYISIRDSGISNYEYCDLLYFRLFWDLKQDTSSTGNILYEQEKARFLQNLDTTSNSFRAHIYNHYILNKKTPEQIKSDSISQAQRQKYIEEEERKKEVWLRRQDSLINLTGYENLSDLEKRSIDRILNDPHAYENNRDVVEYVEFDTLPQEMQRYLKGYLDTTLWKDIELYYPSHPEDDGMRFDTFSNAELIAFLDSLPVEKLYPSPFDSVAGVIETTAHVHLQKVCQILGDRKAYGAFDPDSSQQEVINRWIDSLVLYGGLDSPSLHVYERWSDASDIIIRFGRLGIPRFIHYINFPLVLHWDKMLRPEEIFKQITESDLLHMILSADHYLSIQDTAKADNLGTYMYKYLSNEIFVDPLFRRPRRPVAPTKERQRWHDEHIWPLLLRMNHWYTRRD